MPIIVDGYNLLWSIQNRSEEFDAVSDVELCRIIGRYVNLMGQTGEVIFDGTGPPEKTGFGNIRNLSVSFTGSGSDADTVIENKIAASSDPKRLFIVSSDRRIRKAAAARKAASIRSESFWDDIQKELSRKRGIKEPDGKRGGLNEAEAKQWLKFFDLEQ